MQQPGHNALRLGLATGHPSNFTKPREAFNAEVSLITDSPVGGQICAW